MNKTIGEKLGLLIRQISDGKVTRFEKVCGLSRERLTSYVKEKADPSATAIQKIVTACQKIPGFEYVTADWLLFEKEQAPPVGEGTEQLTPYRQRVPLSPEEKELIERFEKAPEEIKKGIEVLLKMPPKYPSLYAFPDESAKKKLDIFYKNASSLQLTKRWVDLLLMAQDEHDKENYRQRDAFEKMAEHLIKKIEERKKEEEAESGEEKPEKKAINYDIAV